VRISLPGGGARNLVVPRLYVEYQVLGWSPDNRLVAYTRDSGNPGTASCCRRDLYVARPDGSHRRRLFRVAETIHDFPRGSWSPDSKSIAFVTDGRDPHDPSFAVVDVRSGGVRRIGGVSSFGEPPVWSPDSKRLAGAIASGKLVTVSASGGDVHSLGTSAEPGPLSWSPAGALTVVQGVRSNEVLESPDGVQPLRFLFRLPKGVAALTVDRRP
jgi:hypothetical protein